MFKEKTTTPKIINLPESVNPSYRLNYRLTYNEAYQSFYLLANKWKGEQKIIVGIILTVVAVIMLILRYRDPTAFHYSYIALLATLLLFYLVYGPVSKARRGARKVKKQNGSFKIEISKDGKIILPDGEAIDLSSDKDARVIETDDIFAVRPDGRHTFCIPKRILKEDEEAIRKIFKAYLSYQYR